MVKILKSVYLKLKKILTPVHEQKSLACFHEKPKLDFSQNDEVEDEFYQDDELMFCYEDDEPTAILQPAANLPEGFFGEFGTMALSILGTDTKWFRDRCEG